MAKAILDAIEQLEIYTTNKAREWKEIMSAWNNYMPVLVPSEGKHPDCPLK